MSYKVEVIADSSGKYCSNNKKYDSVTAACSAARDLESRWTLVQAWRIVDDESGLAVWDGNLGPVDAHVKGD